MTQAQARRVLERARQRHAGITARLAAEDWQRRQKATLKRAWQVTLGAMLGAALMAALAVPL